MPDQWIVKDTRHRVVRLSGSREQLSFTSIIPFIGSKMRFLYGRIAR
jgi:hypothetical protein